MKKINALGSAVTALTSILKYAPIILALVEILTFAHGKLSQFTNSENGAGAGGAR